MNCPESAREMPSAGVPYTLAAAMLALLVMGLIVLGLVLFFFDPAKHNFYPFCLFHKTTGWLCPGCGSLRAFHHLLNGELLLALRFNLLVMLSLPLFAYLGARLVLASLGRSVRPLTVSQTWIWIALGVLMVFGILRNLPFIPFTWLAP